MNKLYAVIIDCDSLKDLVQITKKDIFNVVRKVKETSIELGLNYEIHCLNISLNDQVAYKTMMDNNFNINWYDLSIDNIEYVMNKNENSYSDGDKLFIYLTGHSGRINDEGKYADLNIIVDDDYTQEIYTENIVYLLDPKSKLFYDNELKLQCVNEYKKFCDNNDISDELFNDLYHLSYNKITLEEDILNDQEILTYLKNNGYFLNEESENESDSESESVKISGDGGKDKTESQISNELYLLYSKPVKLNPAYSFEYQDEYNVLKNNFLVNKGLETTIPFYNPNKYSSNKDIVNEWIKFVENESFEKRFFLKTIDGVVYNKNDDSKSKLVAVDFANWKEYLDIKIKKYPYMKMFEKIAIYYDAYNFTILESFSYDVIMNIEKYAITKNNDTYICLEENHNGIFTDDLIRKYIIDKVPKNMQTLCVSDICYGGTIFDLDYTIIQEKFTESRNTTQSEEKNIIAISGCPDTGLSYKNKYGFFTAALHANVIENDNFKTDILKSFLTVNTGETKDILKIYSDLIDNNKKIFLSNNAYPDLVIPTPIIQTMFTNGLKDEKNIIQKVFNWLNENKLTMTIVSTSIIILLSLFLIYF